jgi:hypothetical protein
LTHKHRSEEDYFNREMPRASSRKGNTMARKDGTINGKYVLVSTLSTETNDKKPQTNEKISNLRPSLSKPPARENQ